MGKQIKIDGVKIEFYCTCGNHINVFRPKTMKIEVDCLKCNKMHKFEIVANEEIEKKGNREKQLLKRAYTLLKQCNEGQYVKNILRECATDSENGIEYDGYSLGNDIADILNLDYLN